MAAAGGDQAGGGEKTAARQEGAPRRRVLAIFILIGCGIAGRQAPGFHIGEDARPKLNAVTQRQRIGVRSAFFRTGENVQSPQNHLGAAAAIPARQLKCAAGEGEMHADSHHFGRRRGGRPAVQQVLVPILHPPIGRGGGGQAGEGQRRREHMLAEAGIRILGIERVEQKRITPLHGSSGGSVIEQGRIQHLGRHPSAGHAYFIV